MFTVPQNGALLRHALNSLSGIKMLRHVASQAVQPDGSVKKTKADTHKSLADYRHFYPEFLPDPKITLRNTLREKLERSDMIARRMHVDIPEFYVGSVLAITSSDPHSPGKPHRFVGICIQRSGCGLRATCILRNVIDHQVSYDMTARTKFTGENIEMNRELESARLVRNMSIDVGRVRLSLSVEILYDLYDPTIQKMEVLKLEKRLDDNLLYLRDALPEYSTFDPDMEPVLLPEGSLIPVNPIKVKLKPRPWLERWERQNLRGVQDLELPERFYKRAEKVATPWEKYDLMKQYMKTIPEEEQNEIFSEIQPQLSKLEIARKTLKRKRTFIKPKKLA